MIRRTPSSRYCVYCQRLVTPPHMCNDEVQHNSLQISTSLTMWGKTMVPSCVTEDEPHKTYRTLTPRQMEREMLRRRQ